MKQRPLYYFYPTSLFISSDGPATKPDHKSRNYNNKTTDHASVTVSFNSIINYIPQTPLQRMLHISFNLNMLHLNFHTYLCLSLRYIRNQSHPLSPHASITSHFQSTTPQPQPLSMPTVHSSPSQSLSVPWQHSTTSTSNP